MKQLTFKSDEVNNHQKAWVIFSGDTDIRWLKIFKPGFRHCFILLNDGVRWMSIDPLSPYTDIEIHHHIDAQFPLSEWLESKGYQASQASINKKHKRPAPWMFCTCVEAIKRILGIHNIFIMTPWQLHQYLNKNNSKI